MSKDPAESPYGFDPADFQAVTEMMIELGHESDRARIILVTAHLDYLLRELLRCALRPVPSGADNLLDRADRALGTFAARIDAAFRLGLVGPNLTSCLHVLRRIRNEDCAHDHTSFRLDSPSPRDRLRHCSSVLFAAAPKGLQGLHQTLERMVPKALSDGDLDFFTVSLVLIVQLKRARKQVRPLTGANVVDYEATEPQSGEDVPGDAS